MESPRDAEAARMANEGVKLGEVENTNRKQPSMLIPQRLANAVRSLAKSW